MVTLRDTGSPHVIYLSGELVAPGEVLAIRWCGMRCNQTLDGPAAAKESVDQAETKRSAG